MKISQVKAREASNEPIRYAASNDAGSQENICYTHVSKLKQVNFKDIKYGEVEKDTIIWLITLTEAVQISSVSIVVSDADKTCMTLALFNQLEKRPDYAFLQKIMPLAIRIGVK